MAASAGVGVLISSIKKWKFRFFLNVGNWLYGNCTFERCCAVINDENHVKSHQKRFVFCNIKYCRENLLEISV